MLSFINDKMIIYNSNFKGGEIMVDITTKAAGKAKELLTKEGKDDWGLRLFISGGG